jgi:hypothetical protein
MKIYFNDENNKELGTIDLPEIKTNIITNDIKNLYRCMADLIQLKNNSKQILIKIISNCITKKIIRQYFFTKPYEFIVTDTIQYSCNTVNDSIIQYCKSFNSDFRYNEYQQLEIFIGLPNKKKWYGLDMAVVENDILIDLKPIN